MQNESAPRIQPLMPPAWDAVALDALGAFPKSLNFVLSRWDEEGIKVRGLNVLGTMAHYPALTKAFMTFNAHVAGASTLPVRVRELVILRLSWLRFSEYEFIQHVILGMRAGITEAEVEQVQHGPDATGWAPEEADLIRAVDELRSQARIGPATWERLAQRFSIDQLMDLVFLIGCYETLGMAINTFNMQLEPGTTPLTPAVRARMLEPRDGQVRE